MSQLNRSGDPMAIPMFRLPQSTTSRMIVGIMIALGIWGIYLAIGATGYFIDDALFDPMRSGFVVFFVVIFLGGWLGVLRAIESRSRAAVEAPQSARRPWNWPSLVSLALSSLGLALWGVGIATWKTISPQGTTLLGWGAAILLIAGVTAGMVALSDRKRRRGKWLGLLPMIACGVSFIVFFARMG